MPIEAGLGERGATCADDARIRPTTSARINERLEARLAVKAERQKLLLPTDALATRIVLDQRRSIGIEYLKGSERVTAHSGRR